MDGLPDGTSALAIVLDDLDHPIQPGFNHWIAGNLPPVCAMDFLPVTWARLAGSIASKRFSSSQRAFSSSMCSARLRTGDIGYMKQFGKHGFDKEE